MEFVQKANRLKVLEQLIMEGLGGIKEPVNRLNALSYVLNKDGNICERVYWLVHEFLPDFYIPINTHLRKNFAEFKSDSTEELDSFLTHQLMENLKLFPQAKNIEQQKIFVHEQLNIPHAKLVLKIKPEKFSALNLDDLKFWMVALTELTLDTILCAESGFSIRSYGLHDFTHTKLDHSFTIDIQKIINPACIVDDSMDAPEVTFLMDNRLALAISQMITFELENEKISTPYVYTQEYIDVHNYPVFELVEKTGNPELKKYFISAIEGLLFTEMVQECSLTVLETIQSN
jgi:hypothetical protein